MKKWRDALRQLIGRSDKLKEPFSESEEAEKQAAPVAKKYLPGTKHEWEDMTEDGEHIGIVGYRGPEK